MRKRAKRAKRVRRHAFSHLLRVVGGGGCDLGVALSLEGDDPCVHGVFDEPARLACDVARAMAARGMLPPEQLRHLSRTPSASIAYARNIAHLKVDVLLDALERHPARARVAAALEHVRPLDDAPRRARHAPERRRRREREVARGRDPVPVLHVVAVRASASARRRSRGDKART
jgi:hypothetical protein